MAIINGTSGPETLPGTSDADEIYGLGGNDVINGGAGNDLIEGGDGHDYINHNTSTNYLLEDNTWSGQGDNIFGGAGNDVIDIGVYDHADGGDGIDRITFYGINVIYGGAVSFDLTGVTNVNSWLNGITGGFVTVANFEQVGLVGGGYDDVLIGNDLDGLPSTMEGLGGNDRLEGRGGRDELYGGDGDDILRGDDGDDLVDGGAGNDDAQGGNGFDAFMVRLDGTDPLVVTIDLTVATAQDTGFGLDTLSGFENLYGRSTSANQTFHFLGDAGSNLLWGGIGNDTLEGRDGNDLLRGGAGADSLIGGAGLDEASYFTSDAGVTIDLGAGTATGGHAQGDTFSSIENINATEFGDSLTGDGLANRFLGQGGDDTLSGMAGIDMLFGGAGADVINGGDDNDQIWNHTGTEASADNAVDTLNGGGGNDNIVLGEGDIGDGGAGTGDQAFVGFYGRGSGITLDMSAGAEAALESFAGVQLSNFEFFHVFGTAHGDHITGSAVGEQINGAEGDDTVIGGGGFDTLIGGMGNDILDGGFANDQMRGGQGDDLYYIDDSGDFAQEFLGEGIDEVRTALASHTLAANVENLTFTGASDHVGIGNVVANTLNGNDGADTLTGAGGDDIINGGGGSDTAVFAGNRATWTISYLPDGVHVSNGVEDNVLTGVEFLAFADMTIPLATPVVIDGTEEGDALSGDDVVSTVEIIHGLGGNDTIQGHGEGDSLYGDAGDDIIHGGEGGDHVEGGADNDALHGEAGADTLLGEAGADVIYGGDGGDEIEGGDGDDGLFGEGGDDTLLGGEGGDGLVGGDGNDHIDGGDGYNYLYGNAGADTLIGGVDGDQMDGGDDNDIVTGGVGFDSLFGGAGDDQLRGGTENDNLTGGMGADLLDGGDGYDRVYYSTAVTIDLTGAVAWTGEAAGDVFVGIEEYHLSDFNDEFTGTSEFEIIYGHGGDDILRNGGGGTHTQGGDGNDHIYGGGGPEEYLYGQDGDDHIEGGVGDDFMFGEAGTDILDGGDGSDGIAFQNSTQTVTVDLRIETAQLLSEELGWDTLISIERLRGETGVAFDFTGNAVGNELSGNYLNDIIRGMEGADSINGNGGDDHLDGGDDNDAIYAGAGMDLLIGGAGADYLDGGADADVLEGGIGNDNIVGDQGDDILRGGAGTDTINGGDGVDLADYALAAGGVTASLLAGAASNDGDGATDTLSGVENLTGSAFADNLTGDTLANLLAGGAGGDTLNGGDGDDILRGGSGVDVMHGGGGVDTVDYSLAAGAMRAQLNSNASTQDGDGGTDSFTGVENLTGSAFNDTLIGDGAVNVLRGGLGADTLIGLGGNDVLWGGAGVGNTLQGGLGNDTYVLESADSITEFVGEGTDTVDARIATYVLANNVENLFFGGVGNFTGTGNAAANIITGGDGNDALRGRGGIDTLNGGLGTDTVDYTLAAAGVVVRIDLQKATNDGDGATDNYTSIENAIGSAFNDVMFGDGNANVLMGGVGQDTLIGGGGNDILMGGSGGMNNQLQGGTGDDWYILEAFDTCVEFLGEGIDTIEAKVGTYTLGNNVENLMYTGPGKFVGNGNALNNTLTGGALNDILRGKGGNDTIYGGGGSDEVQFVGSKAQYTVTAEGSGYRVIDTVGGRDGSTYVESVEVLRFLTGNTSTFLSYPPPAPGALEQPLKSLDEPLTLPGEADLKSWDDAFVLPAQPDDQPLVLPDEAGAKFADDPQILPGVDEPVLEAPLFLNLEARMAFFGDWMITLDPEGGPTNTPAYRDDFGLA